MYCWSPPSFPFVSLSHGVHGVKIVPSWLTLPVSVTTVILGTWRYSYGIHTIFSSVASTVSIPASQSRFQKGRRVVFLWYSQLRHSNESVTWSGSIPASLVFKTVSGATTPERTNNFTCANQSTCSSASSQSCHSVSPLIHKETKAAGSDQTIRIFTTSPQGVESSVAVEADSTTVTLVTNNRDGRVPAARLQRIGQSWLPPSLWKWVRSVSGSREGYAVLVPVYIKDTFPLGRSLFAYRPVSQLAWRYAVFIGVIETCRRSL